MQVLYCYMVRICVRMQKNQWPYGPSFTLLTSKDIHTGLQSLLTFHSSQFLLMKCHVLLSIFAAQGYNTAQCFKG